MGGKDHGLRRQPESCIIFRNDELRWDRTVRLFFFATNCRSADGEFRWAAPEIHVGEGYDEKVDVYRYCDTFASFSRAHSSSISFAIVLWEMIAGRMPFLDAASDGEVANRVIHGERYVDSVAATASREWMVKGKCGGGVWGDAHLTGSRRPAIPPCCGPRARELIETCWSEDARTRLSFGEIVQMMHAMQHEAEEDEYLGIP